VKARRAKCEGFYFLFRGADPHPLHSLLAARERREPMEAFLTVALPGARWDSENLQSADARSAVLEQYDREYVALRRYACFLGVDRESAEDLVQEGFLKLHEHLLAGGDRSNLRAWLYRVAHNLARNRQTAAGAVYTELSDLTGIAEPVANTATPEEALLSVERHSALARAIEELPAAQRECLGLRAQGLRYREIADVLGLSISTVAENIQRGLQTVRKVV
jgi:RNA polymerase sigma-70 factor, ECF subfamily